MKNTMKNTLKTTPSHKHIYNSNNFKLLAEYQYIPGDLMEPERCEVSVFEVINEEIFEEIQALIELYWVKHPFTFQKEMANIFGYDESYLNTPDNTIPGGWYNSYSFSFEGSGRVVRVCEHICLNI